MATIPSIAMIPSGYKASKVYSVLPTDGTGDLDVVRATTATRVNSDGLIELVSSNVPRLDYPLIDGVVQGCPSLLVEPQRTNLLTYSEQFDNIAWTTTNVTVTSNSTISPDGNTTADTLSKSTAGVDGTVVRVVSATASGYVGSIFVKKDTNTSRFPEFFLRSSDLLGDNEIYVQLNTSTGATAIRLQTGTASVSTPVLINGYWRISLYTLASLNTCRFGIRPAAGTTLGVFNENATGSIICYGAQLEAGSYATSYIPTTSESVTRNADVISKTGISSLIGQTEGTVYVEIDGFSRFANSQGLYFFDIIGATDANRIALLRLGNGDIVVFIGANSVTIINENISTIGLSGKLKIAFAYKSGSIAFYVNGTNLFSSSNGFTFSSNLIDLYLGSRFTQDEQLFFPLNTTALYPTRLPNSELAQLTSL
jgi:hypothetical protein